MVNDNSFVSIQAFMVNELHLKGNELLIYAVIFGYTQDGEHWYYGTRAHLAEWCGATKTTVSNCLRSLVEKGYIERREVSSHGYVQVQYKATLQKNCMGSTKDYDAPEKEVCSIDMKQDETKGKRNNDKRF